MKKHIAIEREKVDGCKTLCSNKDADGKGYNTLEAYCPNTDNLCKKCKKIADSIV